MDTEILTSLCAICNANPPKYRCPRCLARTCSLPCTQRHKQWASCSGRRDPAAYVRKTELQNPALFDRDYNFLSGIERSFERGARITEHIGIPPAAESGIDQPKRGAAALKTAFEAGEVRVMRAPKGMRREKENSTTWNRKRKGVTWTVEWVYSGGERCLERFFETLTLAEAWGQVVAATLKRQRKRKREGDGDGDGEREKEGKEVFIYLHIAHTPGTVKVLAPLQSSVSIKDALRGRTVLEFPTFYAMAQSPGELPRGFALEDVKLEARKRESQAPEAVIEGAKEQQEGSGDPMAPANPEIGEIPTAHSAINAPHLELQRAAVSDSAVEAPAI
ncbi:MAG: hypothetical protein M1829_005759 [Trizodia sp. TS-e1964]|nr:MAG: hypothetical protein M1829_005759 [Trizodia sp. TS-e1964]